MNNRKKILIANRGEIAIRIARAARELEFDVITIYTKEDEKSAIWRNLSSKSYLVSNYLNIDEIISIAKKEGVWGIHPGYGFLSEREDFAEECMKNGIKFIGPNPEAMKLSGDKVMARVAAKSAGVPTVPGKDEVSSVEEALKAAEGIGYPVLLKARGGGGGKGMRPVHSAEDLKNSFHLASMEAKNAFGDPRLYVEKYIQNPKHIEVQVLADEHGNYIHLFERDCSLQRRNQKVVEEAPSSLPQNVREKICESAIKIMRKIGYTNAGTVEFIVDENNNFYFIEINARVQVEHPITEMVTGVDIVKTQIKVALGEKIISQEEIKILNHAMELRIYAEDPDNNFMPFPGKITQYIEPKGLGIRCDSWIFPGCVVPPNYDPLLLKLIAWGKTREEVIQRMKNALSEIHIGGIKTNIPFFRFLMNYEKFVEGKITTWSMPDVLKAYSERNFQNTKEKIAAILLSIFLAREGEVEKIEGEKEGEIISAWKIRGWKNFRF